MIFREYRPSDCKALTELFYNTVHMVNAKDYTKAQLDAWAPKRADLETWNRSLRAHICIVAAEDGEIVGFGDIDKTGFFDRLYVHFAHQREGIAAALCDLLESAVPGDIVTHASVTARPFFEKRGYRAVRPQQVCRGEFIWQISLWGKSGKPGMAERRAKEGKI